MQLAGISQMHGAQSGFIAGLSREFYLQKMSEAFQNSHLYPNVGLLGHAASWFNLHGAPGLPIQPSEAVKWQVLFAAKAYMDASQMTYEPFNPRAFGKCTLAEGFTLDHLTLTDIVLFYRILVSYLDGESARGGFLSESSTLTRFHVGLVGDLVLKKCKDMTFANELKQCIHQQQDPNALQGLLLRVTIQSNLFERLNVQNKKAAILSYLDDFYLNLRQVPEWENEVEFYCFLKVLDEVCPELNIFTYFFDFGNGGMIGTIPDMEGMRTLVEHFNTKEKDAFKYQGKLNDIQVIGLTHLPDSLRQLETTNFQGVKRFMVLNGGKEMGPVGGHFDPIFVRREGSQITMIIADSAPFETKDKFGNVKPSHWLPILKSYIDQARLANLKMYTFYPGRQSDSFSCPVTSLRDLLESYKTDLFAFVNKLTSDQVVEKNGFLVIQHFPPNFMKVKQSTRYMDQYEKDVAASKTQVVASKSISVNRRELRFDKTLRMVVDAHTVTREIGKVNFYLRERSYKYFGIIVRSLINKN